MICCRKVDIRRSILSVLLKFHRQQAHQSSSGLGGQGQFGLFGLLWGLSCVGSNSSSSSYDLNLNGSRALNLLDPRKSPSNPRSPASLLVQYLDGSRCALEPRGGLMITSSRSEESNPYFLESQGTVQNHVGPQWLAQTVSSNQSILYLPAIDSPDNVTKTVNKSTSESQLLILMFWLPDLLGFAIGTTRAVEWINQSEYATMRTETTDVVYESRTEFIESLFDGC